MALSNKTLSVLLIITASILLIPLIAMQFSNNVNWTIMDFVVGGLLLFGTGLAIDFIWRKTVKSKWRMVLILTVILAFLLVWAQLAVGIF